MSKQEIDTIAKSYMKYDASLDVYTMTNLGQMLYLASEPRGVSFGKRQSGEWNDAFRLRGEGLVKTSGGKKALRVTVTRTGRAVANRMRALFRGER